VILLQMNAQHLALLTVENALLHAVMVFAPLLRQTALKLVGAVHRTVARVLFVATQSVIVMKPSGLVHRTVVLPITVVMECVLHL